MATTNAARAHENLNIGVTLEVEPVVGPDGYTLDLNLSRQVVEFEGVVGYGGPIASTIANPGTGAWMQSILTPNLNTQPSLALRPKSGDAGGIMAGFGHGAASDAPGEGGASYLSSPSFSVTSR